MAKIIPFTLPRDPMEAPDMRINRLRTSTRRLTQSMLRTAHASIVQENEHRRPEPLKNGGTIPNMDVALAMSEYVNQAIVSGDTRESATVHHLQSLTLELIR